jgi:hypothetical protein
MMQPMPAKKRYRQLKLDLDVLQHHYEMVSLSFKLNHHQIKGILNGSATDWTFQSNSPAFLKIIPSGKLHKYALWLDRVPRQISKIYNGIWEAAVRAGYDIAEHEEII